MGKEKPGDGTPLKPYRRYQALWRSVFVTEHAGTRWAIDVDFLDFDERIRLYRDGVQDRTQRSPARFDLEDGARIEARMSTYGMRRAHLVRPDGAERQLTPVKGTAERWRADLHRRHRGLSRLLSAASFVVLVAVIVIQVPQGIEWLTTTTGWFAFTSPWHLDGAANIALGVAGFAALIERALRLRYSWWLDGLEGMDGFD